MQRRRNIDRRLIRKESNSDSKKAINNHLLPQENQGPHYLRRQYHHHYRHKQQRQNKAGVDKRSLDLLELIAKFPSVHTLPFLKLKDSMDITV